MVHFKKYAPSHQLEDYIQSYFILEANTSKEADEQMDFLQNHSQGTFDLMFGISGEIEMINHKKDTYAFSRIFIVGHQEGFFGIRIKPETCIFGVVFYPESFSKLFNFPLDEITNKGRSLDSELSIEYLSIYAQLQDNISNSSRVELLNQFSVKQLSQVDFSFSKFDQLIKTIRTGSGMLSVKDMVDQSNLSERSLQRKVKQLLGVGPKSYSSVMRINSVLAYMKAHPAANWQDILFQFGYYDQAHFIKDFKRYTGRTPRSFVQGDGGLSNLFLE